MIKTLKKPLAFFLSLLLVISLIPTMTARAEGSYNITYILNGGENNANNPSTYDSDNNDAVSEFDLEGTHIYNPTKTGYVFTGWTCEEVSLHTLEEVLDGYAGIEEKYMLASIPVGSTGDITLVANWKPASYNVMLVPNGGTINSSNVSSYQHEVGAILPTANDVKKDGYTFVGWYDNRNLEGDKVLAIPDTATGNKTFYAKWEALPVYTISYENIDNTTMPIIEVRQEIQRPWGVDYLCSMENAVNPTQYTTDVESVIYNPIKEGHEFLGWSGDGIDGLTKELVINIGETGNKTYTANFEGDEYTISYNLNGGTAENPTSYTYESEEITLNNPTREDYEFVGWTISETDTPVKTITIPSGSVGNRAYIANWKKIEKQENTPSNSSGSTPRRNNSSSSSSSSASSSGSSSSCSSNNKPTNNTTPDVTNTDNDTNTEQTSNIVSIDTKANTAIIKDEVSGENRKVSLEVTTSGQIYKMYDASRGEHFYTKSEAEANYLKSLGWEKDADFIVINATDKDATAVYRLYNPNDGGMHFYTENIEEAKSLKANGWNYEGISHYVYTKGTNNGTSQYRLYNPNSTNGEHNWTTDINEREMLKSLGWIDEGICWEIA